MFSRKFKNRIISFPFAFDSFFRKPVRMRAGFFADLGDISVAGRAAEHLEHVALGLSTTTAAASAAAPS